MSDTKWTQEQEKVIQLRDRNILVSAAAGSGKTAVLVERIISEITEGDAPTDIDRLLVVTFTRAAAAEMRSRIGAELEKRLREQPENEHLQKQAGLLHTAQITTIDSFCQSIIKNYFHVIDLDPAFTIGDETDLELMKQEILGELLEENYRLAKVENHLEPLEENYHLKKEENHQEFLRFTDMFSTGRTDSAVEELILKLYDISTSYPWPEEWLADCKKAYQISSVEELESSEWMKKLMQDLRQYISDYLIIAEQAKEICQEPDGPNAYLDAISSDINYLETLKNAGSYRELSDLFAAYNPARLKAIRDKNVSKELKESAKNLREIYQKNGLAELKKKYFFQSEEEMAQDIQVMRPVVEELIRLTLEFSHAFAARKNEEGILDFSDMEHFALNILVERDEQGVHPSETALELQDYYTEILTDEYQDSNYVQELLLNSLCRAPQQRPWLFMVGDVKQSIYKFRMARPDLFLEKYKSYQVNQGPYERIDLHKNFRSRREVLEAANHIFRHIMIQDFGGIAYDTAAELVPGVDFDEYEGRTAGKAQVILVEQKSEEAEAISKKALEAAVIGEKIRAMVQGEEPLYINGKNGYRPVKYGDIAILLRSLSGWSEEFVETLNDMGIPAYADTKTGYFTSLEVETILNLLHIIDNPRQDIPLAAVLRSCLVGLTDEELAMLGALPQELDFWDKVQSFLNLNASWETEEELVLGEKLSRFEAMLRDCQEFSQTRTVYELLRKIFDDTGYDRLMAAMPSGEQRCANLDILLQQSIEFARNGHRGVYGFTRYIESLRKSNVDFGEANINGENTNAVRIMTIHRSKGLEFPVVFAAGMGKRFNLMDARRGTILDGDYGIGCDYVDLDLRIKQPTLLKRFIANQMVQETMTEEIRILYVALTRAKEQLFITGTASGLAKKLTGWLSVPQETNYCQLSSAQTYLDWLIPALLKKDGLRQGLAQSLEDLEQREPVEKMGTDDLFDVSVYFPENILQQEKLQLGNALLRYERLKNWNTSQCYDEEMAQELKRQTEYSYPYEGEAELPVKISISELKRQRMLQMEALQEEKELGVKEILEKDSQSEKMPEIREILEKDSQLERKPKAREILEKALQSEKMPEIKMDPEMTSQPENTATELPEIPRPKFLQGEVKVSGTARGTLYHMVMEHFPYEAIRQSGRAWTSEDFRKYLKQLAQKGYIKPEETSLLDTRKFVTFLGTDVGRRMEKAAAEGTLRLEQPFMIGLSAKDIYPKQDSQEMIIVQGIIDAFFLEEEEIVLVDYKTDLVKDGDGQALVKKYQIQLDYYAKALERLLDKKVREKIIYSFALGKELKV